MSSYGRYRNSASSYQFRARPGYASGSFAPKGARRYTPKTAGTRRYGAARKPAWKPKFATVAYSRDVEQKFFDKAIYGYNTAAVATSGDNAGAELQDGIMFTSNGWRNYDFRLKDSAGVTASNDLLKGLAQGTTAESRVGNQITGKYLRGVLTMSAAKVVGPSTGATSGDQNGEALITAAAASLVYQFCRTSFRVVFVRDTQVNSTATQVLWSDVFETGGAIGQVNGVHSELNIANMGRFQILSDRMYELSADKPQLSVKYLIPGSKIGNIRYNGPNNTNLDDQGIYCIFAAYTTASAMGVSATDGMVIPGFQMSSRLCFTDA